MWRKLETKTEVHIELFRGSHLSKNPDGNEWIRMEDWEVFDQDGKESMDWTWEEVLEDAGDIHADPWYVLEEDEDDWYGELDMRIVVN